MKDSHILTNGDSGPHNGVEPETVDVIVCLPDRGNLKVYMCTVRLTGADHLKLECVSYSTLCQSTGKKTFEG